MRRLVGLEVTTLRCLPNVRPTGKPRVPFYEVENHTPDGTARRGAWFDRDALERIELAEPKYRSLLIRCLDERGQDGGRLGVAWARPGWFAEADAWIRAQLATVGLETLTVEQERTWSISAILRAETRSGAYYFKAAPPVFRAEPSLTRELGRRHPGRVPVVVAVNEERRWLLMEAFEGRDLDQEGDLTSLAAALRAYAELQLDWVGRADDLLALGCPDRTLEALELDIDPVLGDTEALLPGDENGLSADELAAIPALQERLRAACDRLRSYDLPATLAHGDLHAGNIVETEGGVLFYDWSDACLSVPFFCLVPLFEFNDGYDESTREELRDAYLDAWREHGSKQDLVEACRLAEYLGLYHHAVSYYRIVEQTEQRARWEWEDAFPWFVKLLLERAP